MTKRYRAMKLALQLHMFSQQMKKERSKSFWGMQFYTFHAPGQIMYFRRITEIDQKVKQIARSAKCL